MFHGSIVALVTPFRNGAARRAGASRAWSSGSLAEGTHGFVPVGTTGESPTLTHDEHERVIELCIETAGRPRAGDRRHRLQLHRGSDRA